MAESAKEKDLSTTSLGLIAAYLLPGAIVLGAVAWRKPSVRDFLLEDAEHFTFAVALALTIGLLLNGLRLAVLSRWLFQEMSYRDSDFEGIEQGRFGELQAAIDEVFRLHQFYSALYFLFPIALAWLLFHTFRMGSVWLANEYRQIPLWESLLVVLLLLVVWRILARAALETYEFYHQIAMGILRKPLPPGPPKRKARLIAVFFNWTYWNRFTEHVDVLPPFGKVGNSVVIVGQGFTAASTVSFGTTQVVAPVLQSDKYLTVTVPADATTGLVTVTTGNRALTSKENFRVTPQITGFAPDNGPVGREVTITGVSLRQTTEVRFGGRMASTPNVVSDTEVKASVPANSMTGRITISTTGGIATSANAFTVTP